MAATLEYTIKGFASKYPYKQEPRSNKVILFEGTREELEKSLLPVLKDNRVIKEYKFRSSDKFIMIYRQKSHAKEEQQSQR